MIHYIIEAVFIAIGAAATVSIARDLWRRGQ